MKKRKKSLLVFRTVLVACYFEKLAFVIDRNLCGYYIIITVMLGTRYLYTFALKNRTSFRVTVVKLQILNGDLLINSLEVYV